MEGPNIIYRIAGQLRLFGPIRAWSFHLARADQRTAGATSAACGGGDWSVVMDWCLQSEVLTRSL